MIVYIDTMMGVVTKIVDRTLDTAGHVMQPATMDIKVNETVTVVKSSQTNFTDYKKDDLVLFTTYGGKNISKTSGSDLSAPIAAKADIQVSVPQLVTDFKYGETTEAANSPTWAIDILDEKPTTATFTANATVGSRDFKTGLISTDNQTYLGNVVYLANRNVNYKNSAHTNTNLQPVALATTDTTVPETSTNYGVKMANEDIGRTFTAVCDPNGYVVGLTEEVAAKGVGVITSLDTVRVGNGRYAVEAEMFMMDGSTQTVRFVDNDPADTIDPAGKSNTDGSNGAEGEWNFFPKASDADDSVGSGTNLRNLGIDVNVLVQIEPFTMAGATYYKVLATHNGAATVWNDDPEVQTTVDKIETGVANTLEGINAYDDEPSADTHNIDDNTKFIIAEIDYRYNNGQGNLGGYTDMEYKSYVGFKNIPTIEGDNVDGAGSGTTSNGDILWQRIGNNVFIYPNMESTNAHITYTMKGGATYAVDETYLVLAPVATYAEYSTYKVLKDGKETTLNVSNNNITSVNAKVETAMASKHLISVASTNTKGYVTDVNVYSTAYNAAGSNTTPHARTFTDDQLDGFDKTGVMHFVASAVANPFDQTNVTGIQWLTVADDCTVQIVNLLTGTYTEGNLDSVIQYKTHTSSCDFVYELDAHGYISHIYIID